MKYLSLVVKDTINYSQPLFISLLEALRYSESYLIYKEYLSLLQQNIRILKISLRNNLLKQKYKASNQSFKNRAKY